MSELINNLASAVWGPYTVVAVLICALSVSALSGWPQLRVKTWIGATAGSMLRRKKHGGSGGDITPFQSATAALAGTIGTGNIIGVAAALIAGGPPAVFWMWVSAAAAMGLSYAENRLGMEYRVSDGRGGYMGGPMLYMANGLGMTFMAEAWAAVCVLAAFGVGNITQVNSITMSAQNAFGCPKWLSGLLICVLAAPAVLGGVRGTVKLTEKLVPLMGAAYVIACAAVIIIGRNRIPEAVGMIFSGVAHPRAAAGGLLCGMLEGVRRGVFTNEAGMGSSVMINVSADNSDPHTAGCWGMMEVFADTMLMCSLTALALIVSGAYPAFAGKSPSYMSAEAFGTVFGGYSGVFIALCLLLFAFSTLISWGVTGERAFCYVFGAERSMYFRVAYTAAIIPGAMLDAGIVWAAADIINACMLLPNTASVICILLGRYECKHKKPAANAVTGRSHKEAARAEPLPEKEKNMEK